MNQMQILVLSHASVAFLVLITMFYFTQPQAQRLRWLTPFKANSSLSLQALHFVLHLDSKENKVFSQNGEDGIIEALLQYIKPKHKYFVEFGTESGQECNTRILREKHSGWKGLLMDGSHQNAQINLHKELISYKNIVDLFRKYQVPQRFDLLSVDTDWKDYWILKTILEANYRPRIIISEINTFLGWERSCTVPKESNQSFWDGSTQYFGYSVAAAWKLGREFGYSLLYCDRVGVNCFFVIDGEEGFGEDFRVSDYLLPQHIYRPTKLGHKVDTQNRPYVDV